MTATGSDGTSSTSSTSSTTSTTSAAQSTEAPTTGVETADTSTTMDGATSSSTGSMPVSSTTGDTSSGESTDTGSGTTGEPAPCCVAPDTPTSSAQAATPVGARALPWAVYSVSGGECGGALSLYLYPEASDVGTGHSDQDSVEYLEISISLYMNMWPGEFIGTGPAWVRAHFDGQFADIEGEITILEYVGSPEEPLWCDPEEVPVVSDAHVSFTIDLKADGWDIAGEVLASYCPALNTICP